MMGQCSAGSAGSVDGASRLAALAKAGIGLNARAFNLRKPTDAIYSGAGR